MSSSPSNPLKASFAEGSALSPPPAHHLRDRPGSRPSSRTSIRAHSPSFSLDDPVAVRNQMSTLKHSIRHQQAQLNSLESIVRQGPRPYSADMSDDLSASTSSRLADSGAGAGAGNAYGLANGHSIGGTPSSPPSSFVVQSPTKVKKRSSYDVLQSIAGPESNLPLPVPREAGEENGSIPEGIPVGPPSTLGHFKRPSSPSRSLSRIPIASVGNARALAEDTALTSTPRHTGIAISTAKSLPTTDPAEPGSAGLQPPSPALNRRYSITPGGTTKVLADLQAGVSNARNALENTKTQLRLSQRTVAQLTRQVEDYKEGRERLRVENDGLNNVVARKERLLQEVLERARKAEAEVATLKSQLKTETSTSKKTIKDMETTLAESTTLSQKSEREYLTLRDSMKSLNEAWKRETDGIRDEVRKREDQIKAEGEKVAKMRQKLSEELKAFEKVKKEVKALREDDKKRDVDVEKFWMSEVEKLRGKLAEEADKTDQASKTANHLAEELARLRGLMRVAGRQALAEDAARAESGSKAP